ncbi:hypothetical protein BDF19DRAFT_443616 [Syncephalis fuscata]|nr:hypothetical protein BDF19DRAFT_443616 [Syncephalis fuscata]
MLYIKQSIASRQSSKSLPFLRILFQFSYSMSVNELLTAISDESALDIYSRVHTWKDCLLPLHLPMLDQLLARLLADTAPDSHEQEQSIPFPVLLFHGGPDSGKSQLLLFIALVYALPATFAVAIKSPLDANAKEATATATSNLQAIEIGGRGQGAIFIDMHQEFDLRRVELLAGQHFDRCLEVAELITATSNNNENTYDNLVDYKGARQEFIQKTLDHILVSRVNGPGQLLALLHDLPHRLRQETALDYGALLVDPVNAFYWRDKTAAGSGGGEQSVETRAIRDQFKRLATDWSLAVFASSRRWVKRRLGYGNSLTPTRGDSFRLVSAMDAWPGWWRDIPVTWLFLLERTTTSTNTTETIESLLSSDEVPSSMGMLLSCTQFEARLLTRHGKVTGDSFVFEVADDGVFC